ncbi:MAG: hypothetical protein H0U23_15685 [Blastocatellia bacterium]|nr:hypothetical protein [Blastocatellia bacterium]
MESKRAKFLARATILIWFFATAAGITIFLRYENTPGIAGSVPDQWPENSGIQLATDRHTLIMLAHPRCPCTRASIHELSRITALLDGRLTVYVVFIKPDGVEKDWERSDMWATASAIPHVRVISDAQGLETKRFDSYTSGQTVLYDKGGKRLFSGGITAMRGMEGDSLGADSIVSLVNGERSSVEETYVYGCPLFANDQIDAAKKEDVNADSKR